VTAETGLLWTLSSNVKATAGGLLSVVRGVLWVPMRRIDDRACLGSSGLIPSSHLSRLVAGAGMHSSPYRMAGWDVIVLLFIASPAIGREVRCRKQPWLPPRRHGQCQRVGSAGPGPAAAERGRAACSVPRHDQVLPKMLPGRR
jgi:hypothetical protein